MSNTNPTTETVATEPILGKCGHAFPRPVAWCPFCGTHLSTKEVASGAATRAVVAEPPTNETPQEPVSPETRSLDDKLGDEFPRKSGLAEIKQPQAKPGKDGPAPRVPPAPPPPPPPPPPEKVVANKRGPFLVFALGAFAVLTAGLWLFGFPALHRTDTGQQAPPANAPTALAPSPPSTVASPPSPAPSPDANAFPKPTFCTRAGQPDEQTICSNQGLSYLELRMEDAFKSLRARQADGRIPTDARNYARSMLQRRHLCGEDSSCIDSILLAEKSWFDAYGQ